MEKKAQKTEQKSTLAVTRVLQPTLKNIALCADELVNGGIVAFPTETVYGLGANAFNSSAVRKIFAAKGRPSDNPLIVHVGSVEQIQEIVTAISPRARKLIKHFMPGPLTLIFQKKDAVPDCVTGGLNTVAVRMPNDKTALELIRGAGIPIAAPSANRSGFPSPTTAQHVYGDLKGRIPYILDGGASKIGVESTVMDIRSAVPVILRVGAISLEEIEKQIGMVEIASSSAEKNGKILSPGMKYRHYAPRAEVLFSAFYDNMHRRINEIYDNAVKNGKNPVIIGLDGRKELYENRKVYAAGKDYNGYAQNLYALLRASDAEGYDTVIAEGVPTNGIGAAIVNRLIKASNGVIV